jgi:hypothetical protein
MTPQQREALKQALDQHSLKMAVKDAAPEDVAALPQDFAVPSYNENNKPLYDNQLFPAVNSVDDLVARGYATPDGQITENGQMALSLRKVGALKEDYTLNDTGKVLLASQDDILKEENIDLYREYKRLELDEAPDVGIWDMAKGIASDLVKGANAIAENELGGIKDIASSQAFGGAFEPYGAEPLTPEKKAESRIKTEEAAKDLFVSSAGLARAAATEIDKVAAKTMWDGMMQDYQVSYLEQKYDRDLADMEKVNTAEVADELAKVIGINTQFAEGRQQAEELIGPEATQKAIEEGRAAGLALSVVNPLAPEALVARTAFGAARTGVSAAFKPISRKLLESEAKAAQALQASQRVTGLQGNLAQVNYLAQKAEQEAIFAERQADKYSKLGLSSRANDARAFADKLRTRGLEAGAKSQGLTDEIARASEEAQKLAQDAAVSDKINFIAQRAREMPGLPIQAIGGLIEGTGNAMIGIDKGLSKLASKIGADKAYNAMNKITTLSGIGGVGMASGFGPVAFIPAAIKTAWSIAPFLKGAGHFVRMIGKETANARELIPFWQRVANYETLGATQRSIAHLMDTSTLGSRVTGLAGDVAKGVAASYPIDLAFEWISEGGEMDMNTLKQAAAETVVFGGGGALGGITAGSKERIKKLQRGSALNFYRNIKDGGQRVAFNALNDGMKRSVGTYASAFPNLNIRFTDQGGGAFDPASNTAFINPMSRNPLKPLLAHEINHYILIRNQMEGGISAALVGDGVQTGGLLRGKDGTLDENFLAFKEEYTRRLEAQHNRQINQKIAAGEKIPAKKRQFIAPTDNDIAIEYFVDSMADDMMEMAETGELGKQAGRMLVNRKMQAFGNAILQKAPIIKDFFYKLGGVTDQNGRAVYGNGLLAEGIREIPQMKKLFRQMISESAGRPMHVAKVTKGESEGHTIPITGKNDPILDEMTSMYESDENGVPLRDKNGDRIPLSDETEKLRSSSGLLLLEDQENRLKRGETLEDGELRFNPEENAWTGEYLTDRQIQILRASGRFNNAQLKQLEMLNGAAQENTGRRFLVFNQPATKKRKGKRLDYGTLGISMREIVPYGIKITKDGNILVRLMSVQQLHANAFEKATSKRGQSLYRGDAEAILRDVNQVIENHGRNEPTDAYFKREYGTEWEVRKNFINTVFGNVGKGQKDINPLLAAEKAKNAVVKTYRIDRINKATELEGRTKLPYQNHLVKVNFMPEGEPILDANGEPKDLRYTPRYEERMPEQRQMPEVSPEDINPVANKQEAQGLWADGKRMFALNEMDEKLTPITSKAMLDSYSADAIGWMEPEQAPAPSQRFMPEKEIPVAKTTSESLEESDNKELKSTGVDVPESVDDQSVISSAIKVANSQPWRKGRDFKLDLQRRVLEAAKQAGVNISERTLESIEYLARVGFKDALIALEQNPNAIGWYDEKTKQALGVMSLLFPEIATNENARFAFTWALAVTSNGLKVDKNFELAERVYRQYRKTGKMPTDIKAGQAQKAINKSLDLFNQLTDEWGINNTRQFMQTEFTVGEISRLGVVSKADKKEVKPGGEHSDTIVRGSAILGPKIGNGFFSNLYGLFDALTMDRWLVRTWGRWTGTLVEFNPELTQKAKTRLEETLAQLTPDDKSRMDQAIGKDVSSMTTEDLAFAIQKASMKPKLREVMNATATGEEFRMAGNGLAKYLDGQKEAPANPAERNFIREIFGLVLDELKSDAKYADLTMADLQAVLWYAEKRLYETAKVKADQDAIDSSDADGYEDDEAPDYANAAIGVARKNGVSSKRINEVLEKIKNDNATITQPSDEGRSDAETKQQESAGGFAGKQKQKFKQYIAVTTTRRNRTSNEKALWSYQTKSGVDSGDAGVLKPKAKKNLGVKYISEWKPGRKLATIFRNNNLPAVKFLELDPKDAASAQKFADTIQQSKDESPHGAAVYVYPADEYQGMKLFLSDSGKSGFAVKPDGDIVSVFSMEKGSGRSIMEAAISAGGKKLDAFDTILPEFYGTHGFVEASRMPWNDEFAPDGWDKQTFKEFNNGEPDVVMMVLDPNFEGEYTPRKDIYTTDYDQAVEMQDAMLKKVGRKKPVSKTSQPAPQKTTKKSQAKGDSSAIANAAKLK